MPWPKMAPRCHELGMREATTRSLESAIMAPSLNTASSTISSVGKYLCEQNKLGYALLQSRFLCRQSAGALAVEYFRLCPSYIAEAVTLKGLGQL